MIRTPGQAHPTTDPDTHTRAHTRTHAHTHVRVHTARVCQKAPQAGWLARTFAHPTVDPAPSARRSNLWHVGMAGTAGMVAEVERHCPRTSAHNHDTTGEANALQHNTARTRESNGARGRALRSRLRGAQCRKGTTDRSNLGANLARARACVSVCACARACVCVVEVEWARGITLVYNRRVLDERLPPFWRRRGRRDKPLPLVDRHLEVVLFRDPCDINHRLCGLFHGLQRRRARQPRSTQHAARNTGLPRHLKKKTRRTERECAPRLRAFGRGGGALGQRGGCEGGKESCRQQCPH